ncbi:MAG: hypothetical protein J1E65_07485 [Lachnospiraceae bacterium]|nr:hypothetical protein [Lachnospiraceae bacterium]
MKDILKMIRFDYISVKSHTVPYVIGFIGISLVLSLFGIPLGVFCVAAPIAIFGPVQELYGSDSRKIYGILPVRRDAVTRASFLELTVPLFAGELLSFLFLLISRSSKLYRIFPKSIGNIIETLFDFSQSGMGISVDGLYIILMFTSAYLCVFAAYLEMASKIQGSENDIRNLLLAISLTVAVFAVITALVKAGILPPLQKWPMPRTVAGKWLFAVILNIIAAGVSVLFCEITVKKTADFEI